MRHWATFRLLVLTLALMVLTPVAVGGVPLQAQTSRVSLSGWLEYFHDPEQAFTFATVRTQDFHRLPDFRSLGYDDGAHWFRTQVSPEADVPPRWIFAIGTPELEYVDVWAEQADGTFKQYEMGYYRPYENRPLKTRLFALPIEAFEGAQIYFRVRTNNAINVQAEIWQPAAFSANQTTDNFFRGLYFGILLISVILYAIMGARLRDVPIAAYSGYVASLFLFHLGTNGYIPVFMGANGAWFTDVLPRLGWLGGGMSIVLMWDYLLNLKDNYRRVHWLYWFTIWFNLALLPFILIPSLVAPWLLAIVELANVLNCVNFFIGMILVLLFWKRTRQPELMVYFIAFVIPALGTLVNTANNQGLLIQNEVTSNFYQVTSLIHVLVMSYGMALRLRQVQRDKAAAEHEVAVATQRAEEQRRFVAMLSHEFRNPLVAIDRAVQMIQMKAPNLMPSEVERLLRIRANTATLSNFVDNFLLVEMLEHRGVVPSRKSCSLRATLENVVDQLSEADANRVNLRVVPDDLSIYADETLLSAAVRNLISNALRYSPAETSVEVHAACDDAGLRIRIVDYGPGLDEEALVQLGTPYFRAKTSLGKKGTGLGYYFTQCIAQAHGGSLRAYSPEGRGLTVEMVLPNTHAPSAA